MPESNLSERLPRSASGRLGQRDPTTILHPTYPACEVSMPRSRSKTRSTFPQLTHARPLRLLRGKLRLEPGQAARCRGVRPHGQGQHAGGLTIQSRDQPERSEV